LGCIPQLAGSTSRNRALVVAALLAASLAGCARPSEQVHHISTPAPQEPTARSQPVVAPSTSAPAVRTPAPATSSPAPAAVKTPSGPQILSLRATPAVVHSGQSVVWDVRTTPDVVSVDAKVSVYALQFVKQAPGHFGLSFAIPNGVPWFFHGTYNLDVSAHSNSGEIAHRSISLAFE
jgi:glucose/arabinose dehydrogenase